MAGDPREGAIWVTGRHSVEEVLVSARLAARKVLLSDAVPERTRKEVLARAAARAVPVITCPKEEWRRRTGETEGAGLAVEVSAFPYDDIFGWIARLPARARVFLLDGITDPQNLGSVIRNARAFGFSGVIVPRDRSCPVTAAVFRASAGAAAHVPVVLVTNLARSVEDLKEAGFWIHAACGLGATDLPGFRPSARAGFVLGSEEAGIRRLVLEKCDGSIRIPMVPGIDSLNVAVASGVIAYACAAGEPGTIDIP